LLGIAEPVRPDQYDRRLGRIEGLLQLANPRQAWRKIASIEEGSETSRSQNRINIRRVSLVHARVTDKHVVGFISHREAPTINQEIVDIIHTNGARRRRCVAFRVRQRLDAAAKMPVACRGVSISMGCKAVAIGPRDPSAALEVERAQYVIYWQSKFETLDALVRRHRFALSTPDCCF
jgi:hypothetical protein